MPTSKLSTALAHRMKSIQQRPATGCRRIMTAEHLESRMLLANVYYVDVNASLLPHNGTSWDHAFPTLQPALTLAVAGDEIHVADGVYKPTGPNPYNARFQLVNGTALLGGYAGFGAPNPDARRISQYRSILSGDIGTPNVMLGNIQIVVECAWTDAPTLLEGFTITGGNGTGGGISSIGADPTIRYCTFQQNGWFNGPSGGGAMYVQGPQSPTVINCLFVDNWGTGGGAILNQNGATTQFINCTFSGNEAKYGGVVYNFDSSPTFTNCIMWGNHSTLAAPDVQIVDNGTSATTLNYCDVQGGWTGAGSNNISVDPLFIRSPSFGSDMTWGTGDDDYGNLRLQPNSPAIDVGDNISVPSGINVDLSGLHRIIDVPDVQPPGDVVDMGAYERGLSTTVQGGNGKDAVYVISNDTFVFIRAQIDFSGPLPDPSPSDPLLATLDARLFSFILVDTQLSDDKVTLDVSDGLPPGDLTIATGSGSDTLIITATGEHDDLDVQPGQITLNTTSVTTSDTETVLLDAPANGTIDLNSLMLSRRVGLRDGKNLTLRTTQLNAAGAGTLDLEDNDLIIDYSGVSPLGTWNGSGYTGVMGLVASGQNGGGWDGTGLVTGMPDAAMGLTALGAAEASDTLGLSGSDTAIWNGQAIDASCVLIKYTYAGDADLNGLIDGNDYGYIDFSAAVPWSNGFGNGDFNYDGVIDGNDYGYIDFNIASQGPAL